LPLTARPKPDMAAMIESSVELEDGLRVLAPAEMVIHAATHLFADGDLAGGLRNLWDIDRLIREFDRHEWFWNALIAFSRLHGLEQPVGRAVRLSHRLFGTPIARTRAWRPRAGDALYLRRLLARDGWGRARRPVTRLGFYVRSHWLRMPPTMLARHLWVKARRKR
jgi:hypothetical protein